MQLTEDNLWVRLFLLTLSTALQLFFLGGWSSRVDATGHILKNVHMIVHMIRHQNTHLQ